MQATVTRACCDNWQQPGLITDECTRGTGPGRHSRVSGAGDRSLSGRAAPPVNRKRYTDKTGRPLGHFSSGLLRLSGAQRGVALLRGARAGRGGCARFGVSISGVRTREEEDCAGFFGCWG